MKRRILATLMALAMCLTLLPVGAMAANTVTIKEVTYNNNSDGTASATITFSYTGSNITYIDPMIGLSKGSYELDLDTRDAANLPTGWSLTKNADGTWTLVCNPLNFTGTDGEKPLEGTEIWVGVSVSNNTDECFDQLKLTVPLKGESVTVRSGKPDPNATYTVTVNYDGFPDGLGYTHQKKETHKDGETYSIESPIYDDYIPTTPVVTGTINGADVHVNVTYVPNSFKVTVLYYLGDGVLSATDPATNEHYATGRGSLSNFNCSWTGEVGNETYVPGRELIAENLKNGAAYEWEPPAFTGLRPDPAHVDGKIEGADVEVKVTYYASCNGGGEHVPNIYHEGTEHRVVCAVCGIELEPPKTQLEYANCGEGTNQHDVKCGICHKKLDTESCAGPRLGLSANCEGTCAKCNAAYDYGTAHAYGDYASLNNGKHERVCSRCEYHDEQNCNKDKWDHNGSYPNGQHRHICSVCSYTDEEWTNCAYVAQKTMNGFHRRTCECGAGSLAERCTYELEKTPAEHIYTCSQHCGNTYSGNHYGRSPVRENYKASTVVDFGGYDLVTYCGRCGYEMSRVSKTIPPRPWPEEKNKNQHLKDHFNSSGSRTVRPGRGNSGGGAAAPEPGRGSGGRMVENEWIDAVNANVITDGIAEYMDENFAALLLPADDALNAYYEANPTHIGEGWSVDLEPDIVFTITAYNETTRTLTLDVTATYGVYVTETATGVSTLIGEGYPLTVDFPVDLSFGVPAGIAANGEQLTVEHNHGGRKYTYIATVTTIGDDIMATATFTSTAGLSTFVLSPKGSGGTGEVVRPVIEDPIPGRHENIGGGGSSGGSTGGGGTTETPAATEKTETVTNADGSTTESKATTTETKNADGSVTAKTTETATTTAADGTRTETKAETSTTTKQNADGGTTATTTATETATTTAADGVKTVTETKTESTETLDRNGNGTVEAKTTETVKDENGKVLETTVTESKGTVSTDENGTKSTVTTNTATTTDADGNVTTTVTVEEKAEVKDGTVSAVVKDENGNVLSAEANVSEQAVEEARRIGEPVRVPMEIAPVAPQAAETAVPVAITMPAAPTGGVANMPRVEIAVPRSGPGIIAMIRNALGKLTPVKECYEGSVILPVSGSCEIVIVDNTKSFTDVSADDWYYEGVTFVTAREIFNGVGDGAFDPNGAMTRAMLAQALYNFDRDAAPNGAYAFTDAAGKWYVDAAGWAASIGVVTGTDKGFEGEESVTREQVATMLYRYAKAIGCDVSASASLSGYVDADDVSPWALDAMRWAVGAGLMQGADGKLDPRGDATRAQLAAIMQRFVQKAAR